MKNKLAPFMKKSTSLATGIFALFLLPPILLAQYQQMMFPSLDLTLPAGASSIEPGFCLNQTLKTPDAATNLRFVNAGNATVSFGNTSMSLIQAVKEGKVSITGVRSGQLSGVNLLSFALSKTFPIMFVNHTNKQMQISSKAPIVLGAEASPINFQLPTRGTNGIEVWEAKNRQLQGALTMLGYHVPITGTMDVPTWTALESFVTHNHAKLGISELPKENGKLILPSNVEVLLFDQAATTKSDKETIVNGLSVLGFSIEKNRALGPKAKLAIEQIMETKVTFGKNGLPRQPKEIIARIFFLKTEVESKLNAAGISGKTLNAQIDHYKLMAEPSPGLPAWLELQRVASQGEYETRFRNQLLANGIEVENGLIAIDQIRSMANAEKPTTFLQMADLLKSYEAQLSSRLGQLGFGTPDTRANLEAYRASCGGGKGSIPDLKILDGQINNINALQWPNETFFNAAIDGDAPLRSIELARGYAGEKKIILTRQGEEAECLLISGRTILKRSLGQSAIEDLESFAFQMTGGPEEFLATRFDDGWSKYNFTNPQLSAMADPYLNANLSATIAHEVKPYWVAWKGDFNGEMALTGFRKASSGFIETLNERLNIWKKHMGESKIGKEDFGAIVALGKKQGRIWESYCEISAVKEVPNDFAILDTRHDYFVMRIGIGKPKLVSGLNEVQQVHLNDVSSCFFEKKTFQGYAVNAEMLKNASMFYVNLLESAVSNQAVKKVVSIESESTDANFLLQLHGKTSLPQIYRDRPDIGKSIEHANDTLLPMGDGALFISTSDFKDTLAGAILRRIRSDLNAHKIQSHFGVTSDELSHLLNDPNHLQIILDVRVKDGMIQFSDRAIQLGAFVEHLKSGKAVPEKEFVYLISNESPQKLIAFGKQFKPKVLAVTTYDITNGHSAVAGYETVQRFLEKFANGSVPLSEADFSEIVREQEDAAKMLGTALKKKQGGYLLNLMKLTRTQFKGLSNKARRLIKSRVPRSIQDIIREVGTENLEKAKTSEVGRDNYLRAKPWIKTDNQDWQKGGEDGPC